MLFSAFIIEIHKNDNDKTFGCRMRNVSFFLTCICLTVCQSIRPCTCVHPSVRLSIYPSVRLSVCPSVRMCVRASVRTSICLCLYVCVHLKHSYRRRCRPPLSIIEMHTKEKEMIKRCIYDHPLKLTLRSYAMLFPANNERLRY